jgi:hypothetical protein
MENLEIELTAKEIELQKIINLDIRFWAEYCDKDKSIYFNSNKIPRAYYNLIVSIRDCELWKVGMKPTASFRITDVKNYFGLKGNSKTYADQLRHIKSLLEN